MADILVVSDFNAELASRFIAVDHESPVLSVETAPYGHLFQTLSAERPGSEAMTLFVWTRPEGIAPSFATLTEGEPSLSSVCSTQLRALRISRYVCGATVPHGAGRELGTESQWGGA